MTYYKAPGYGLSITIDGEGELFFFSNNFCTELQGDILTGP